jgi:hypothetical protein
MFDHLIEALQPKDGLELLLVRQMLHETWKILRWERHQTLGIDWRVRQSIESQDVLKAERAAQREALSKKTGETAERPRTELSQMKELCDVIEDSVEDIDALAERGKTHQRELMHHRALEDGIAVQEQLDRLITAATKRRNDALQMLNYYSPTLAQRSRKLSDAIIDGEAVEADNPRLIERHGGSNTTDVVPEDAQSEGA